MLEMLLIVAGVSGGFGALGLVADYVLPRFNALNELFETLPMAEWDE